MDYKVSEAKIVSSRALMSHIKSSDNEGSEEGAGGQESDALQEIPEIFVTEDPDPGSMKTLYDDEPDSDDNEDHTNSQLHDDNKNSELEQELEKMRDRLIDEMSHRDRIQEKLSLAKKVAETFESKLRFVQDEYQVLLSKYQKQTEILKGFIEEECGENKDLHEEIMANCNDNWQNNHSSEVSGEHGPIADGTDCGNNNKTTEIGDLKRKYEDFKITKEKEIRQLRDNIAKLSLDLHEEQEKHTNLTRDLGDEGSSASDAGTEADEECKMDSKESLKAKVALLECKLVSQESLQKKLKGLQQQNIVLNTVIRDQQKKYEEALKTLKMVQDTYSSRNQLQSSTRTSSSKDICHVDRENPEGQSEETQQDLKTDEADQHSKEGNDLAFNHLNPSSKVELLMKALKKSQSEVENFQNEIKSLQIDLRNSIASSNKRANKVNDLQREILDLKDSNENLKLDLEEKEGKMTTMRETESKMEEELKTIHEELSKYQDLKAENSRLVLSLAECRGKSNVYKQQLIAMKAELKRAAADQTDHSNLMASIPKLHEKITNDEREMKELKHLLKIKEDNERKHSELMEREKKEIANEKLAWKREVERRLTCNWMPLEKMADHPQDLNVGEVPQEADPESNHPVLQKRTKADACATPSACADESLLLNPPLSAKDFALNIFRQNCDTVVDERCSSAEYHYSITPRVCEELEDMNRFESWHHNEINQKHSREHLQRRYRPTSSPVGRPIARYRRLSSLSRDQRSKDVGSMALPSFKSLKYTSPFVHQPRVLLWGADGEGPAKKLIAVGDRVLIKVSSNQEPNDKSYTESTVQGTVRFIGPVKGIGEEIRIGVKLEEPVGHHDGKFNGIRYFRCQPLHGTFVMLEQVLRVFNAKIPHLSTSSRDMVGYKPSTY